MLSLMIVKPKDFEQAILELAITTRVPLTRANVLFYTGAGSKQADKWLDGMVGDGLLDLDSDDEGEVIYTLRGARRPAGGATDLARCVSCGRATPSGTGSSRCARCGQTMDSRLRALRMDVERAGSALTLFGQGKGLLKATPEGDKSLLTAGLLGLLGPIGWLYAAPLREAVPATTVFLLVMWCFPSLFFLLMAMLPLLPVSALVGALYAWKHNRAGHRSGLLTEDDKGAQPR